MKHIFRAVAFDETIDWDGLPPECRQVFGVYLFKVDERTYCCELRPSSRCEPLNNVFCGLAAEHPFVEEHEYDVIPDCIYITPLINPAGPSYQQWVSDPIEIDAESGPEAWEDALEHARGNEPQIPGLTRAYLADTPA